MLLKKLKCGFLLSFLLFEAGHCIIHEVRRDDTIWSISKKYNISEENISSINKIHNKLLIGQKLIIPDKIFEYIVKKGDNLTKIALENNSKIEIISELNNLNKIDLFEGQKLKIAFFMTNQADNETKHDILNYYTVKKRDTLLTLSKKFNVTKAELKERNKKTSDTIYCGEKLLINSNKKEEAPAVRKYSNKNYIEKNPLFPVNKNDVHYVQNNGRGIIVYLEKDTLIRTIKKGIIKYAGVMSGYNNVVIVQYDNELYSVYGFLSKISVHVGENVSENQPIGNAGYISFIGNTGLYLEIRHGKNSLKIFDIYPFLNEKEYALNNKAPTL